MSYISRVETKKALDQLNTKKKKKKKAVKLIGYSLSVIALVLVAFLIIRMVGNDDVVKQEATVVTPKLTSPNESPTKEVDRNSNPNDPNNTSKTPAIDDKDKGSDKETNEHNESENGKENNPSKNEATTGNSNGSQNVKNINNNSNTKPVTDKNKKEQKTVYLTFDDGPNEHTEAILNILDKYGIHATFFSIGTNLKGNEQALKDTVAAGHYVGLHSMSHSAKKLYKSGSSANFIKEFKKEQGLVEDIIGTTPILIRPPYGSAPNINKKFRDDIVKAGFKMWDWTLDSRDWKYPRNPDKIVQEVKKHLTLNTEVILMHERAQTVKVLPQIIEYIQKKGYAFAVYKPDHHLSVNFAKDKRL